MKRKKVLHLQVICNIRLSDLQEEIIASLPVNQYEVVTAYLTGNPETSTSGLTSMSEKVKYFNFTKKDLKGLRLKVLFALWRFCKDEKFDIVITHRFKAMDSMMKLNKLLRIPHCIGVIHNLDDYSRFYRRVNAALFLDSSWTIVAVSDAVKNYLCHKKIAFNCQRIKTINNAIDVKRMRKRIKSRDKSRQELGLHHTDFVFGSIGRMVSVKGYIYLIKAFEKLCQDENNQNIKLVLIGTGKLKDELQNYCISANMQNQVIFPGEIVDAKLLIPAFDVFVLSSLSEGLPLVLLEAMAAKTPIIATNVGGVPSVIKETEKLILPKDINSLYSEMKKYYKMSDQERHDIGNDLYNTVTQNFDIPLYRKKYLSVVSNAL